ncbi:MAG: hypothetical protein V4663_04970 [Bacteroidota bacterium]
MSTTEIALNGNNGNLIARITCPKSPQVYVGLIWRYLADETLDKKCGAYRNSQPDVLLGSAIDVKDKLFLVQGVVIHHNEQLPSPYEIEVTILQDGVELSNEVPSDGGKGSLSTKDIAFVYHFKFK